ncbi:YhcH/YjgK/YiaL family protein (plasmid) [Verrucomicrobiaceae bacterium 227]
MAIFGPATDLQNQWPKGERWEAASEIVLRYLTEGSEEREQAFSRAEGESAKLDVSDGIFLIEEAYFTKQPADVRWEAHREWADVQVILAGVERMDVATVGNLKLVEDLSPQRDMLYFESYEEGSALRLEAGDVAIYLPVDGHRPGLQIGKAELVRKLVVKVRL